MNEVSLLGYWVAGGQFRVRLIREAKTVVVYEGSDRGAAEQQCQDAAAVLQLKGVDFDKMWDGPGCPFL